MKEFTLYVSVFSINVLYVESVTFHPVKNTRYWGADPSSLDESSRPYWYRVRPTAIMVETTGYALLAQLALNDISYSHAIVRWLSEQQNYGGGFASTQVCFELIVCL